MSMQEVKLDIIDKNKVIYYTFSKSSVEATQTMSHNMSRALFINMD